MEAEIVVADFVLVICTPLYYQKSLERSGGVGYEQQIITGQIAAGVPRERFIPILKEGSFEASDEPSLPPHFLGTYALDMRTEEDFSFELLLRTVFDKPSDPPPDVGEPPKWLGLDDSGPGNDQRLATFDIDGWELLSGVAQHHRSPETFEIPDESSRQSLSAGGTAKLMFRIQVDEEDEFTDDDAGFVERMWVKVTGMSGPYFVGSLSNQPITAGEQDVLRFGTTVVFLPEHVISIWDEVDKDA